jgi:hypothetical protein
MPPCVRPRRGLAVGSCRLSDGHGYLSRQYGLAVDSLIEADVVLADRSFVTAYEAESTELFWAVRAEAETSAWSPASCSGPTPPARSMTDRSSLILRLLGNSARGMNSADGQRRRNWKSLRSSLATPFREAMERVAQFRRRRHAISRSLSETYDPPKPAHGPARPGLTLPSRQAFPRP